MNINSLLAEFENNPKAFVNRYKLCRVNNSKLKHDMIPSNIDVVLDAYYKMYGEGQFSRIFYHIKNGDHTIPICKMCKKNTEFKSFNIGYKTYCSLHCSRKDGKKTSLEKRKEATVKRQAKMRDLLADPIKGAEYRQKISTSSKYYNNLPGAREKRSETLKQKILSGEWAPNITNSWTRWDTHVDGKKFRSSFEGLFFLYHSIFKNEEIEFETLRLPYNFKEKAHVYIVDFIDHHNRVLYEVKPQSLVSHAKNIAKEKCAMDWCDVNGYVYKIVSEDGLKLYIAEFVAHNFTHSFLEAFQKKYQW